MSQYHTLKVYQDHRAKADLHTLAAFSSGKEHPLHRMAGACSHSTHSEEKYIFMSLSESLIAL